jgi:hypothetical protein
VLPLRRTVAPILGVLILASLVYLLVSARESQFRYRGQPLTDILLSLPNNNFWKVSCCPFGLSPATPDAYVVSEALTQAGTNAAGLVRSWLIKHEPDWRVSAHERIWRILGRNYVSADDRRMAASRCAMLNRELASLCIPELFACLASPDQLLQCNAIMALTAVAAEDNSFSDSYRREMDLARQILSPGGHLAAPSFVFNRYLLSVTDATFFEDYVGAMLKYHEHRSRSENWGGNFLALHPSTTVPLLTNALRSTNTVFVCEAITALSKYGTNARVVVPILEQLAADSPANVAETADMALAVLGRR